MVDSPPPTPPRGVRPPRPPRPRAGWADNGAPLPCSNVSPLCLVSGDTARPRCCGPGDMLRLRLLPFGRTVAAFGSFDRTLATRRFLVSSLGERR